MSNVPTADAPAQPVFCRVMLCKRGLCRHAVSVCLSVCVSVTFVDCVKTYKHIFKIFHNRVATLFHFFNTKGHDNNRGRWGRLKSRNQRLYGLEINNCCTAVSISHFAAGFLFTAGIGRPSAVSRYTLLYTQTPRDGICRAMHAPRGNN